MNEKSQTEGNPDEELSASLKGQPLTDDALKALQSQMEAEFAKRLKEAEQRWQSDKDRRIPKLEAEQSSLRKTIEEALKLGKSDASAEEVERQIKINRLLNQMDGEGNLVTRRTDEPESDRSKEALRIAKELNLDMGDADIARAVESGNLVNVMKVAMSKATTPTPGPEDNPLLTGGGRSPDTAAEIETGYLAEIKKVPRGNVHMAAQVKAKWRKKAREAGLLLNV